MAFNRRIMNRLEEACEGNVAMKGFLREVIIYEMREPGNYTKKYEERLKKWAAKESEEG